MSLLRRALRTVGLRFGKDRYLAGTDLEGEFGLLDLENQSMRSLCSPLFLCCERLTGNSFFERPHPDPEFKGTLSRPSRWSLFDQDRQVSKKVFESLIETALLVQVNGGRIRDT